MFEFVIYKKKDNTVGDIELEFIKVPNSFNKKTTISTQSGFLISYLAFETRALEEYFYEDDNYMVLLNGSVFSSDFTGKE